MVGKCAGLFLRAQWLGVAELRPASSLYHHHDRVASCSFAFLRRVSAGSMEGRAPASPFAPSSPKRPSLWRRRAPPSTDHASQWRGDLCEPIAPDSVKGPQGGRSPWRAVDLATATVGRSTRWLERFYWSGPIPFPNRNSKPVQSPPNLFQLDLYRRFHDVDATPSSCRDLWGLSPAEIGWPNIAAQEAHGAAIEIMTEARLRARQEAIPKSKARMAKRKNVDATPPSRANNPN